MPCRDMCCTNWHAGSLCDMIACLTVRKGLSIFSSMPKVSQISNIQLWLLKRLCVTFTHAGDSVSHAQVAFSHACHRSLLRILFHFLREVFFV